MKIAIKRLRQWWNAYLDTMPPALGFAIIALPTIWGCLIIGMVLGFYIAILSFGISDGRGIRVSENSSLVASVLGVTPGMVVGTIIGALLSQRLYRASRWGKRERLAKEVFKVIEDAEKVAEERERSAARLIDG